MDILNLVYFALQSFANGMMGFILDSNFIPITLIVISVLFVQYRNNMMIQRQMYGGRVRTRLKDLIATSILAGILAGLGGSILITVLGITFLKLSGLITVLVLSVLLMFFVHPRFVCLSYAGGFLSVASLLLNQLINIGVFDKKNSIIIFLMDKLSFDVSALMIIVAIMHLIEAVLMFADGHRGAVPVFMKHKGKIVGGFVMQRMWIIPILFYILATSSQIDGQTVATPSWWPLFGPDMSRQMLKNSMFGAIPLLAMLGYSDFSIATPVIQKVRRSSRQLLGYSLILLILALFSYKIYVLKYLAAFFAVIGHEALIIFERYKETSGVPIWSYAEDGVIVVDTIPNSHAERIGIKSGDKLISINNTPVKSIDDVLKVLGEYLNYIWIDIVNFKGEKRLVEFSNYKDRIKELGIITVPKDDGSILLVEKNNYNIFRRFIEWRNKRGI